VAAAASRRDPPSTGAKNSTLRKTKENKIDAIYNGHPVNLTAPPIEIYHSVFAKFRYEISLPIDNSSFTAEELTMAMELVTGSLAFHKDEDTRIKETTTAMVTLVDEQVFRRTEIMRDNGRHYKPDGCVFVQCEKSQDATELLPHSVKSKTVLEREDRIPSNKHSVITSFTILQKMYVVLPLSAFQTLIVL